MYISGGDNGAALDGDAVTVTCTEANTTSPDGTYKWYFNDAEISGAAAETYEINPDNHNKAGTYKCEATFTSTVVQSSDLTFNIYGMERSLKVLHICTTVIYLYILVDLIFLIIWSHFKYNVNK